MQYNNTLDIINVNSKYIDYLRTFSKLSGVLEHKADVSTTGGRKYVGVILSVDNKEYFIPIHSGSKEEKKRNIVYKNNNGIRKIKRSKFDIYYISTDANGNEKLQQVLKVAYMIPLPKSVRIQYSIQNEANPVFKTNFQNLYNWINQQNNKNYLVSRANKIYFDKIKYSNLSKNDVDKLDEESKKEYNYSKYYLDFKLLEEKCELWEKHPGIKNNFTDVSDIKNLNDHVRHKEHGYNTSMIEGKHFIYNDALYRIDQIELKPLGTDSAILTKLNLSGEEKYIDNNFTSDAKFNLHLQKADNKILANIKDIKNK